jgi:peptidyl-prolyl cis-trans isomerase A (cyclophilin A)
VNRTIARTLTIIVPTLALACSGKEPKKAETKAESKTEAKAESKTEAKAEHKAAAPEGDAKAPPERVEAPSGRTFRKNQPAVPGMTPDEVKAYAEAQGDPKKGEHSLEDALAGDDALADPSRGKLTAIFDTTMGKFECELFEDKAPITVANFVGLARGVRPSYDKDSDSWLEKKFFDGILFHRVIDGFMIQTGDPTGTGTGGPGYVIVDEVDTGLKHNKPGLLSMANRGPNTGSSQFFVTVVPTAHLDGKHAIFGACDPKIPKAISKVKVDPRRNHRPYEDVKINTIEIVRK